MKFRDKLRRRHRVLSGIVVVPVALALSAATAARQHPPLALVNETPSLPRGLYWHQAGVGAGVGRVVAVHQPDRARAYLASLGVPRDLPLIKRVVASGGQTVCVGDGALETPIGRYRVLSEDRQGRALPAWVGCRALAADELFILGDTETSFDSRYFGPVRRDYVIGVYREAVTW